MDIKALLDADADKYFAKSAMSQAVGYARNQWAKLVAYVDHGDATGWSPWPTSATSSNASPR